MKYIAGGGEKRYHPAMSQASRLSLRNRWTTACLLAMCLTPTLSAAQCKQSTFEGRADDKAYNQPLGPDLEFRLSPLRDFSGWEIRISPHGSDDDWAYVVTPPLRFGNAEYVGTGYGETARQQLSYAHEVRFVLNAKDYDRMMKLVQEVLWPTDRNHQGDAGANYLQSLKEVPTGMLVFKPVTYDRLGASDQARWVEFEVTVTVPNSFTTNKDLKWTPTPCPPPPH